MLGFGLQNNKAVEIDNIYYTPTVPTCILKDNTDAVLKDKNGLILLDVSTISPEYLISAIYIGRKLIWEGAKSCYGKGYWINDKGWLNNDGWKNK